MELNYEQANEIRLKYPEDISQKEIELIINEWVEKGIEREDMLYFSSKYEMNSEKMKLCDFDLCLQATRKFHALNSSEDTENTHIELTNLFVYTAISEIESHCSFYFSDLVEKETEKIRLDFASGILSDLKDMIGKERLAIGIKDYDKITGIISDNKLDKWQNKVINVIKDYAK